MGAYGDERRGDTGLQELFLTYRCHFHSEQFTLCLFFRLCHWPFKRNSCLTAPVPGSWQCCPYPQPYWPLRSSCTGALLFALMECQVIPSLIPSCISHFSMWQWWFQTAWDWWLLVTADTVYLKEAFWYHLCVRVVVCWAIPVLCSPQHDSLQDFSQGFLLSILYWTGLSSSQLPAGFK